MLLTKAKSFLSPLLSCNFATNIGTNAELKAPSAKTRRKKLGKRNAAKKASDIALTPTNCAINTSRIKPKMRDIEMKKEIVKNERNMLLILSFNLAVENNEGRNN